MLRVAVVDDEQTEREHLSALLKKYGEAKNETFDIKSFANGILFLADYQRDSFDLIFMDVDMPYMDGIEAAHRLRKIDTSVVLIFVTNIARYAIRGYEVDALDYLLKPLTYQAFSLKLPKAVSICKRNSTNIITVKTRNSQAIFPISSLIYIESNGHHITYHTEQGDFPAYGTMKDAAVQLPEEMFFRVNSGYIVNLGYVSGYDGSVIFLNGRGQIEVSRARKKDFLEAMTNYHISARKR